MNLVILSYNIELQLKMSILFNEVIGVLILNCKTLCFFPFSSLEQINCIHNFNLLFYCFTSKHWNM